MRVSSAPRVLKVNVVTELVTELVVADDVYSIDVCAASRRNAAESRLSPGSAPR